MDPSQQRATSFSIEDARSVIARLRTVSKDNSPTAASVFLYADGEVRVTVNFDRFMTEKITGRGNSLTEAVYDLMGKSELIGKALK